MNEFAALRPVMARAASAAVCAGGALAICSGLQLFMVRRWGLLYVLAPYLLLAFGLVTFACGWRLLRKSTAARLILASISSGVLTTASIGWAILGLLGGFLSPVFGPFTPAAAFVGFVLTLVALPSTQRADALRKEMKARGEDLGL